MAAIPGIMVDIGANVARMQQDMRRLTGHMETGFSQIGSAARRLAGIVAGAFTFRELIRLGDEALKTGDRLAKLSQSTGVSVETLSSLKYAAELADVNLDVLGKSLGILSRNMLDAQAGTGEAKDAIKALGISIQDSGGNLLASDKVMGQIADRFAAMRDGSAKTALAMRIFGRSGADLIPLLNQGSAALEEMRAEAEKMGLVFSTETAQQMERVNDNFTRMKMAVEGVGIRIMTDLSPTLENLTNILVEASKSAKDFNGLVELAAFALKSLATAGTIAWTTFKDLGEGFNAIAAAIVTAAEGDLRTAWEILNMEGEDSKKLWAEAGKTIEQIWDKAAENALRNANRIQKALKEGPVLAADADKQAQAIQNIIDKLWEESAAIRMGADAYEFYTKGLFKATDAQKDQARIYLKIIDAHAREKAEINRIIKSQQEEEEQVLSGEKAIYDYIDAIKMQAATAGMTGEEIAKLNLSLLTNSKELQKNIDRYFATIRAAERYREEIDLLKGVIEETKTPMDRYEERMREIQGLLSKGMIGPEVALRAQQIAWDRMIGGEKDAAADREQILLDFADRVRAQNQFTADAAIYQIERQAAIFKQAGADEVAVAIWAAKEKQKASREWQDGALRGLEEYAAEAMNAAKNAENFFARSLQSMEDALLDFVTTGKASFSDLINSIIKDLLRLMIRQNITGPLAGYLVSGFGSIFAGGGAGAGMNSAAAAGVEFHRGGIAGIEGMARSIPSGYLMAAPRLHQGLMPGEYAAVLRQGEGVFTPGQMRAMGNRTDISISIPVNAGSMDSRKAGQLRRDMESELEPVVRRIVERYI